MKSGIQKGFTLVELLLVIAIIGVLSSILVGQTEEARSRARFSQVYQQMINIYKAAYLEYDEKLAWPADAFPGQPPSFTGKYISQWPKPPCKNWTYDWDNWSNTTIRITVRNSDEPHTPVNSIFYICIETDVANCDSGGPGGGVEMKTVTNKRITCRE